MAAVTFSSAREPVVGEPQPHRRLSIYEGRAQALKGERRH